MITQTGETTATHPITGNTYTFKRSRFIEGDIDRESWNAIGPNGAWHGLWETRNAGIWTSNTWKYRGNRVRVKIDGDTVTIL